MLPVPLSYEFPTNVNGLIEALAERGVARDRLFLTLQWAILHNPVDTPLYIVIGTPMRGVRGGALQQHLTVWHLDPIMTWGVKEAFKKFSEDQERREHGEKIERILLDWAKVAEVKWCVVREDRPEIVTRRDDGAPLTWFAGRTVEIWGCGAIGSCSAEFLARAGVAKLVLRDDSPVAPGVLVRQAFDDQDIGCIKSFALRDRLHRIRPELNIEVSDECILENPLNRQEWGNDVDVVIDATASNQVNELLELKWNSPTFHAVSVISMVIGHRAECAMVVLAKPEHSGGPFDVYRRMKLEACANPNLRQYLDEFWPIERRQYFQPEPGCSDATFFGSAADVTGLTAMMLNLAAADLRSVQNTNHSASGHFVSLPTPFNEVPSLASSFKWRPDRITFDVDAGSQVRIAPEAWADARLWIARSRDENGPDVETGGLLFGEKDDAARVIWISELSGPPPDSELSKEHFICGVVGTAELNSEKQKRSRGSIHYVGMWHTHPTDAPLPSSTDWNAMKRLAQEAGRGGRHLMLILGRPLEMPSVGTYVFKARDFITSNESPIFRLCSVVRLEWD